MDYVPFIEFEGNRLTTVGAKNFMDCNRWLIENIGSFIQSEPHHRLAETTLNNITPTIHNFSVTINNVTFGYEGTA